MNLYKGFTRSHLEWAFGVRFTDEGVVVPYYGINGDLYREKLFTDEGEPLLWMGDAKAQVPYGLETLKFGGDVAFLTEGESCAWALRCCFPRTPVIGIPGSSSWRPEWVYLLARFGRLFLSFDNDEAGRKLLDEVWPSLTNGRRVVLPQGADTRDAIQLLGGEAMYERLLRDADYIAGCTEYLTNYREEARSAA